MTTTTTRTINKANGRIPVRGLARVKILVVGLAGLAGLLVAGTAHAGRGGSAAEIKTAVQSGSVDGILASLERAEFLLCNACLTVVVPLLDHDSYKVREAAAWWIRKRPARIDTATNMRTRLAGGGDPILARNAADALGNFKDPQALPLLGRVATDSTQPAVVRAAAAGALGTLGSPEGAVALTMALGDGEATVRTQAVSALRLIRGYTSAAPLVPLLTDKSASVRRATVLVVGQLRDPAATPGLISVLTTDSDARTRRQAAWALGQLKDPTAFNALTQVAQGDADSFVRAQARSALHQIAK